MTRSGLVMCPRMNVRGLGAGPVSLVSAARHQASMARNSAKSHSIVSFTRDNWNRSTTCLIFSIAVAEVAESAPT